MARYQTCEGKRRMWRGNALGTFKCGRKARFVFQSYVGLCTTHYVCGDSDCTRSVTAYPVNNWRELAR